jgi:hypothetical protein
MPFPLVTSTDRRARPPAHVAALEPPDEGWTPGGRGLPPRRALAADRSVDGAVSFRASPNRGGLRRDGQG